MAINYIRLWKLLINKGIAKMEMRKRSGIRTTVLAKMGKMKPYQWIRWHELPQLWDVGLTILFWEAKTCAEGNCYNMKVKNRKIVKPLKIRSVSFREHT